MFSIPEIALPTLPLCLRSEGPLIRTWKEGSRRKISQLVLTKELWTITTEKRMSWSLHHSENKYEFIYCRSWSTAFWRGHGQLRSHINDQLLVTKHDGSKRKKETSSLKRVANSWTGVNHLKCFFAVWLKGNTEMSCSRTSYFSNSIGLHYTPGACNNLPLHPTSLPILVILILFQSVFNSRLGTKGLVRPQSAVNDKQICSYIAPYYSIWVPRAFFLNLKK